MYIYTIEYYSTMRMEDSLPFATTRMDLEHIMLSKLSEKEKDKYQMILVICESKKSNS